MSIDVPIFIRYIAQDIEFKQNKLDKILINPLVLNNNQELLLHIIANLDKYIIDFYIRKLKNIDNIESITKKILKTKFTDEHYTRAREYINKDFCILSHKINKFLHEYEREIFKFVTIHHKKKFNEIEKLVKENYTVHIIADDLSYFTLVPVVNYLIKPS
tara:strand:- start:50 stop:529 length:480 start_codon:yes stop_codon:yes gene_type:complete